MGARRIDPERVLAEVRRLAAYRGWWVSAAILVLLTGIGGSVLWARCGWSGCPDVRQVVSFQPGGASVLLDRTGARFADLAPVRHEMVGLESLPPFLPQAFIAVEDRRFFRHDGVDWIRVVGALGANLREGRVAEGFSTLPMQLSRTLFSERIRRQERTLRRKLLEIRVAGEMEHRFSKEEILELYLNHIYLGRGVYGVQAAARHYFGKDAAEVDLGEAALLAALPRSPSFYDPRRNPQEARRRRDLVLTLMEEQGRIPPEEARQAREQALAVLPDPPPTRPSVASYFVEQVRRRVEEELGEMVYREPLRIHTTLDLTAQRAAERELEARLAALERGDHGPLHLAPSGGSGDDETGVQGAVVLLEVATGDVLAWVGGRSFTEAPFDRVQLARRQVGSVFKPFVYGAALESGIVASQPVLDEPYRMEGRDGWEPRNFSGEFEGRMSLREALVRSQNVPSVRLAATVGDGPIRDFAHRAGLEGGVPSSPVAALGVSTASPLEVAEAYSAFASDGSRVAPRLVQRVVDRAGEEVYSAEVTRVRVTDPGVAWLITDILREAVDRGTGARVRAAGLVGPAAGKTGTTDDATDAWFAGYTPDVVGAVWIGFDGDGALPEGSSGGGLAAPVWARVVAAAPHLSPSPAWGPPPAGLGEAEVDPYSGLLLAGGCRPGDGDPVTERFLPGTFPETTCPRRGGLLGRIEGWFGALFASSDPDPPAATGEPHPELGVPLVLPAAAGPEADRDAARGGAPSTSGPGLGPADP